MKVDMSTQFISPLLDFSTKSVFFRVDKVPCWGIDQMVDVEEQSSHVVQLC